MHDAGFAVSKEALRLFIQEALPHSEKCFTGIRPLYKGDDDTEFGMCMQSVGVPPGIIKDEKGRGRFSTADPVYSIYSINIATPCTSAIRDQSRSTTHAKNRRQSPSTRQLSVAHRSVSFIPTLECFS